VEKRYTCIIIDDEEMAIKVIANHLELIPDFDIIGQFSNPVEAFQVLDSRRVDVMFLDIQMPEIIGTSMLQMMKHPPLTVFTTAYREYALDGYELDVVDYLMKPIGFQRFLQTISKIRERSKVFDKEMSTDLQKDNEYLFIRSDRSFQKVRFDEILHIEAIRNHIKVVTDETTHMSIMPISEVEEKLPDSFVRVHRSFIVNAQKVTRFNNQEVKNEKAEVPIGRSYKEEALDRLKILLLGKDN